MPATDEHPIDIVKTTFSTEGVIELPPLPGDDEPQLLNLFQAAKCAYRFETDDGRASIVPMDISAFDVLDDPEGDARAMAEAAFKRLACA